MKTELLIPAATIAAAVIRNNPTKDQGRAFAEAYQAIATALERLPGGAASSPEAQARDKARRGG